MIDTDRRFMSAAIRLARKHEGWTATNPSVACLIVKEGVIIGLGVTAMGGRPHAEPLAIAQAGKRANGATAYLTLEPCAHHGRTPPCAQSLITAGIARVVTAVVDPDDRVNQKGHAMLRVAGIAVTQGVLEAEAMYDLAGYLTHKRLGRPFVTLKLAVSADGLIGIRQAGQVRITGETALAQSHLMRARHHAILVGSATVLADDPALDCRLPGLQQHTPIRIVLDASGRLHDKLQLVKSANAIPTLVVAPPGLANQQALKASGVAIVACECLDGRIALPELLDDLGARGIMSLMVEGGAAVAQSFLAEGLVDAVTIFTAEKSIGTGIADTLRIASPVTMTQALCDFDLTGDWLFGQDRLHSYRKRQ